MRRNPHIRFWASLTIAFLLQLVALPDAVAVARPLWVPLVLAYWALEEPRAPTLLAAFLCGLMLDVLYNTVLGQHSVGLLLLVYTVIRLRSVFVLFPLWQLTVAMIPAWAGYCLMMTLVDHLAHHRADPLLRWLPAVSSTLFWPLVHTVLDGQTRRSRPD